jgi:hypothetical protein
MQLDGTTAQTRSSFTLKELLRVGSLPCIPIGPTDTGKLLSLYQGMRAPTGFDFGSYFLSKAEAFFFPY